MLFIHNNIIEQIIHIAVKIKIKWQQYLKNQTSGLK